MAKEKNMIIGAGQDTARRAPKTNTITCGDCLEVMQAIPDKSVDMVLCDLPYGTTQCKWDTVIPFASLWEQYTRIIKPRGAIVLTASQPFTSALVMSNTKGFKYCWVWNKKQGGNPLNAKRQPLRITEDVVVFNSSRYNPQMRQGKMRKKGGITKQPETVGRVNLGYTSFNDLYYPTSIIEVPNCANKKDRVHPTQKPVALFEYLILTYTEEGETVLDNCIGSGTTAIACINTGRNYIGIEKEEKYCRRAEERIHALRSPAQNTMEICHTAPNSRQSAIKTAAVAQTLAEIRLESEIIMRPYYEDEYITLYNADCLSVLPTLPRFQVMLTDPPYPNDPRFPTTWDFIGRFAAASWEAAEDNAWLVSDFSRRFVSQWISNYQPWVYYDMLAAYVSNSMAACSFGPDRFQPSLVFRKGAPKVCKIWSNVVQAPRRTNDWWGHPSEKDIETYTKYVAMLLPQNGLLVDPFAGSGTSLVACKRLNRKAIGIEIEEKYCRIIVERLSQCEMGLGALNMESSLTSANTPCMPLPQQVEAEL